MRSLIWMVILFAAAAAVAIFLQNYSGSAMILLNDTLIRMNLNVFILSILVIWLLLYVLVRLSRGLSALPSSMGRMNQRRRRERVIKKLNEASLGFFEGRFQKTTALADELLKNREVGEHLPFILTLGAASAREAGDKHYYQKFLDLLGKQPKKNQLTRYLLLAEDALDQRNLTQADAYLAEAEKIMPNLTRLLRLKLRYANATNNAEAILRYVKQLHKNQAISDKEAKDYELRAYQNFLTTAMDAATLRSALKKIPEEIKANELNIAIAEQYQATEQYRKAARWVQKYYPQNHQDGLLSVLVTTFPYLREGEQKRSINTLESWLDQNKENIELLITLGRISFEKQLWGKAQKYFDASLTLKESVTARLYLSKIAAEAGDEDKAATERAKTMALLEAQDSDDDDA